MLITALTMGAASVAWVISWTNDWSTFYTSIGNWLR